MKNRAQLKIISFLLVFLCISIPFAADAQQYSGRSKAMIDAKRDAEASVNGTFWFLAGCIGNVSGIFAANLYHYPVPTAPLLGKSPEYVSYYTDTYISERRKRQSHFAARGCLVTACTPVCLWGSALLITLLIN